MATRAKSRNANGVMPRMVVVHNDPADDVKMLLDQIEGSEAIQGQSLMAKIVWLLEHYGTLTPNGYRMNDNVGPLVWRSLVAIMRVFDSNDQWAMGDLAQDGLRFANVTAVDAIGDVALPDEDDAYDPAQVEKVSFGYDQSLAVTGRSRQTLYNWRSCCKKFPQDPDSPYWRDKPEWRGALFSAFYELRVDALPYEFVDQWLRRAAQPISEGGATVDQIRDAKMKYLGKAKKDAEEAGEDVEVETTAGKKKYITLAAARRKWTETFATHLMGAVPDLGEVPAVMCAEAALGWIYRDAPPELLESALNWGGEDDDDDEE